MVSLDQLAAKADCGDLLYRFASALDRTAHEEAADMFADDGVAVRPDGAELSGQAVREMLLSRPTDIMTVHVLSNLVVTSTGTDTAEGLAYVVAYRAPRPAGQALPLPLPAAPHGVGDWRVQFRRTAAGWRLSRWQATAILAASQ